jgi:hypothetical protein
VQSKLIQLLDVFLGNVDDTFGSHPKAHLHFDMGVIVTIVDKKKVHHHEL